MTKDLSSEAFVPGNARQMEHGVGIRPIVKVVDFRYLLSRYSAKNDNFSGLSQGEIPKIKILRW